MISYEVSIGLIIIAVILCVGSLSLSEIVIYFTIISCGNNVLCFSVGRN